MYEELVKELRDSAEWTDRLAILMGRIDGDTHTPIMRKAADAIEELQDKISANVVTIKRQSHIIHAKEKDLLRAIDAQPRWISVTERLPDEWGDYLCWYEYYHVSRDAIFPEYGLGVWNNDDKCWCGEVANGRSAKVLAWMPLPKPYEPPKEET